MSWRSAADPQFQQAAQIPAWYTYAHTNLTSQVVLTDGQNTGTIACYGTVGPAGPAGSSQLTISSSNTSSLAGVVLQGSSFSTIGGTFNPSAGFKANYLSILPPRSGIFTAAGSTTTTFVSTVAASTTSSWLFTVNTPAGSGAGHQVPIVQGIAPGIGFSTIAYQQDTSTYNWVQFDRT